MAKKTKEPETPTCSLCATQMQTATIFNKPVYKCPHCKRRIPKTS